MRAAIYIRVSTRGQEDNASLETQEASCRDLCVAKGWEVVEVYREVHTGAELWERVQLSRMRAEVRAKRVQMIVCHASDRLARDPVHLGVVISEALYHKADVAFVTEPFDGSPEGELIRYVRGYTAKVERLKILERTKRGLMARVASGLRMSGCKPKYGYVWADDRKGTLQPQAGHAEVVARIYADYCRGASLGSIAGSLTREGIPAPKGGALWRPESIRVLLKHVIYKGDQQTPALVTEEIWTKAQAQLTINMATSARNVRKWQPDAALLRGGHIFCGYCQKRMKVLPISRRGVQELRYYCNTRKRGGNCPGNRYILTTTLDPLVRDKILETCEGIAEANCGEKQEPSYLGASLEAVERELQKVQASIRLLMADRDAGAYPGDLEADYFALLREKSAARAGLARERERLNNWAEEEEKARVIASHALAQIRAPECNDNQWRHILLNMKVRVEVTKERVTLEWTSGTCGNNSNILLLQVPHG